MIGIEILILWPSPGFHFRTHSQGQSFIIAEKPNQPHGIVFVLCCNLNPGCMIRIGPCVRISHKIALVGIGFFIGHRSERNDAAQFNIRIERNHSCQKLIPKRVIIFGLYDINAVGSIIGQCQPIAIGLCAVIAATIITIGLWINKRQQSAFRLSWNDIRIDGCFAIAYHMPHSNTIHGFAISGIAFTTNFKRKSSHAHEITLITGINEHFCSNLHPAFHADDFQTPVLFYWRRLEVDALVVYHINTMIMQHLFEDLFSDPRLIDPLNFK